jgi:hypothetical protein
MDDRMKSDGTPEGSAEKRADVSDVPNRDQRRTKAGQEASSDRVPDEHDHEHQSNYGGGGPNGGTNA